MTVVSTTPTTYYNAFQTTLKRSMTSASQTTGIILNPIYDNDGVFVTYTTTPLLLTFIQGTKKEIISAGGFTQDATGAFTLTDVTRDLPRNGSSYTGQGSPVKFTSNTTVLVGLTAQSMNKTPFKDAANTFTGLQTLSGGLTLSGTTATITLPTMTTTQRDALTPAEGMLIKNSTTGTVQQYVGGAWSDVGDTGTPNGSTTVAGKYEEATVAEQGTATATGSTGARLVVANANLVKTSSGAGDENKILILNASGQIPTGFFPNIPVSKLNSGTGATATTFWRGDETWATPSSGIQTAILQTDRATSTASSTVSIAHGITGTPSLVLASAYCRLSGSATLVVSSSGSSTGSVHKCTYIDETNSSGDTLGVNNDSGNAIFIRSVANTNALTINVGATITMDATNVNVVWVRHPSLGASSTETIYVTLTIFKF